MKVSIISIVFILIVHNILHFLTETLTIPKIKDLVNAPHDKYEDIYKTINQNNYNQISENDKIHGTTDINSIPPLSTDNLLPKMPSNTNQAMKDELKSFMKKQLKDDNKPEYMHLS